MSSDEDEILDKTIFQEPNDYFQPEKPCTYADYTLLSGQKLRLRLVGHNPLWGHHLWNGGQVLSTYLQRHASTLVHGKTVLELGAGAGLPSLVAAILGAEKVVVTDYPDADLIENLAQNISTCSLLPQSQPTATTTRTVVAEGYLWGTSPTKVLAHLPPSPNNHIHPQKFSTLLLADLLFNHTCHPALLSTITHTLARTPDSRALVFFTPYRPWLLDKDMAFFDLCRDEGRLVVEKVAEEVTEKVMFEGDEGDELLRRTVFGFEVRWGDWDLDLDSVG